MSGGTVLRKLPGETREEFIARIVAARPPLSDTEKVQLRAIFRPVLDDRREQATPDAA